ncbi:glycosyltransferase involved in cell wall biosynthesis [Rhodococcus sp. 27YEA15]
MSRVSVVIPIFRSLAYVEVCLKSVLGQTRPVDQIILVDDCGGDESMAVAGEYLDDHGVSYEVVTHPVNRGLGCARNSGLAAATGDLVWFLDSDDEADERFVETLAGAIDAYDADFACCRTLRVDESGSTLRIDEPPVPAAALTGVEFARLLIRGNAKAYACTKLFRREILGDKPWDEGQGYEDIAAMIRLSLRVNTVALLDEPLYRYLYREGSISTALSRRTLDLFKVSHDAEEELALHGLRQDWSEDFLAFRYREVLTSVAHVAMRADHQAPTRPELYDEALTRVRRAVTMRDAAALIRAGHRREALFALLVKTSPQFYSSVLRYR